MYCVVIVVRRGVLCYSAAVFRTAAVREMARGLFLTDDQQTTYYLLLYTPPLPPLPPLRPYSHYHYHYQDNYAVLYNTTLHRNGSCSPRDNTIFGAMPFPLMPMPGWA